MKIFRYKSGEVIKKGDLVTLSLDSGYVETIFLPKSEKAKNYDCEDTGGVLIQLPTSLGLVLIVEPNKDEDLVFFKRNLSSHTN